MLSGANLRLVKFISIIWKFCCYPGLAQPSVILVKIFLGTFVNTACDLRLEFVKYKSCIGTSDIVFGVILYFWMMLKLPHLHLIQIEYSMTGKFLFLQTFIGSHLMPWKAPGTFV